MFSVGYNFEEDFLKEIKPFVKSLSSIYFPIPTRFLGSGRTMNEPKFYDGHIESIIKFCKEFNLKSLMLVNPTCEGVNAGDKDFMDKIVDYLNSLDITGAVVVNPIYMKMIKSRTKLEVQASVNCYIKNLEQVNYYKNYCDIINTDRDINRNIPLLKKISKIKPIKLLVNEGCLGNCPYRQMHYNLIAHKFEAGVEKNLKNSQYFIDNA